MRYSLPNRARSGSETDRAGAKQAWSARKRTYLRRERERAAIQKPITPHNLRHTYTIYLLNAGVEWVDIQALLGHESSATPPIDTNVGQDQMAAVVVVARIDRYAAAHHLSRSGFLAQAAERRLRE